MPTCLIVGGGLAGLACATALDQVGFTVTLLESRPFAGGRATSYTIPSSEGSGEIDNCQHILLRCCVNLLDFYRRLGMESAIRFSRAFFFLEPGGRLSMLEAGLLPAPLHFFRAFAALRFLGWRDKSAIGLAMLAVRREWGSRSGLDELTMLEWLHEKRQTPDAIQRFWRPILVSAVNEEPERMAARHGLQVMRLGFLAGNGLHEMGIPAVPLGDLYRSSLWKRSGRMSFHFRSPADRVLIDQNRVQGVRSGEAGWRADYYVSAVPFERVPSLLPELAFDPSPWEHSPITGIHFWFDRPVTSLPHAALLDRTIQWFFNKQDGRYLQLVVSASRALLPMAKQEVVDLALRELSEFLPEVRAAVLEKAHVVKEVRATFSARPGLGRLRPRSLTPIPNLFLAGDWTHTGWPATMEGAVRSGYLAAEAVTAAAGHPQRFLLPDLAG